MNLYFFEDAINLYQISYIHHKYEHFRNIESYDTVLSLSIHIYIPAVDTSRKMGESH